MNVRSKQVLCFLFPAAAAGLLYYFTMAPDVYVSDFAEFQYLPAKLGVPHPNGFPLFIVTSWLWSQLDLGTQASQMNLFAVLTGSLAVGATALFTYTIQANVLQALFTGFFVAITPTLWKYSVAAERYGLNLLWLCAAFASAWLVGQRTSIRWVFLSGFFIGLALATHPTTAVIGPLWLFYLISNKPSLWKDWRSWAVLILGGFLPLLSYFYIPWRWATFVDAPLTSGIGLPEPIFQGMVPAGYTNQLTFSAIQEYLAFGAQMVSTGRESFSVRFSGSMIDWWSNEFSWWLLGLITIGLIRAWHTARQLALVMFGTIILFVSTVAATYGAKVDAYMLPATWIMLIIGGFGVDAIFTLSRYINSKWLRGISKVLVILLLATLLIWRVITLWADHDQSRYIENRRDWETILVHPLAEDSAILADWSDLTPFWYMQQIEGMRTDLLGLFPPQPSHIIDPWIQTGNALYLTAPLQHGYASNLDSDYQLTPWGRTVLIQKKLTPFACPDSLQMQTETPAEWPLMIEKWDAHFQQDKGGRVVRLFFCWSAPSGVSKNQFLAFELVNETGKAVATINQPLLVTWFPMADDQKIARGLGTVPLYLAPGVAAGTYRIRLTTFETNEDYRWQGTAPPSMVLDTITVSEGTFTRYLLNDEFAPILAPRVTLSGDSRSTDLRLRAWSLSNEVVRPGDPIEVELIWDIQDAGALSSLPEVQFRFWDWSGMQSQTQRQMLSAGGESLFRSKHILRAPVALGDASYFVEIQLVDSEGVRPWRLMPGLWLGQVQVEDREHQYELSPKMQPLESLFFNQEQQPIASLKGYQLEQCDDAQIKITFYWEAHITASTSYSVFVHLVDRDGAIVTQHDGIPSNGSLPTTIWIEDEIIVDSHVLNLPPETGDNLRIFTGLYTLEQGRLSSKKDVIINLSCTQ